MTGTITVLDQPRTLDALARPTSAVIAFYLTGTNTLATIYQDFALTTPATNPVTLSSGQLFPEVFLDPSISYRRVITYGDGTIHDIDPVNTDTLSQLASSTGAELVGTSQAEGGAANVSLQTMVRKLLPVYPEQFGAVGDGITDDTAALQAAIDAAGNWASANYARELVLTRVYKTTATLALRPYVSIVGIGRVRSGIKPTMSTGPALDADSFSVGVNGTGFSHQKLEDFGIDGVNCTGSAYALRLRGQKNASVARMGFVNYLTTQHAVQIVHNGYAISFDNCWFNNNNRYLKLAREDVSGNVSFPTNIVFRTCNFEEGPNTADEEAVLLEDCNAIRFTDNCIFQSLFNRTTILIKGGASRSTTHEHIIEGNTFEENGNGHGSHSTLKIVGVSANRVDRVVFDKNNFHGGGGGGGHLHLTYSRGFRAVGNSPNPAQKWTTDGGNNDLYDIDATLAGTSELQSLKYSETTIVFDSLAGIVLQDGPIPITVTRQAVGTWYLTTSRAWTATEAVVAQVEGLSTGYTPMQADSYPSSTTRLEVYTYDAATGATLTDPLRVKVRILAKLVALP